MKTIRSLLPFIFFIATIPTALSQKYKTSADTFKLNKEYAEVAADIASLSSKLNEAQNDLPGYRNKAADKVDDAQKTAIKSNEQSTKAIDGDVGDARKAKKKAKKALRDAKDVSEANNKVESQEKKIAKLSSQLQKKQERLQELEEMRTRIRNGN